MLGGPCGAGWSLECGRSLGAGGLWGLGSPWAAGGLGMQGVPVPSVMADTTHPLLATAHGDAPDVGSRGTRDARPPPAHPGRGSQGHPSLPSLRRRCRLLQRLPRWLRRSVPKPCAPPPPRARVPPRLDLEGLEGGEDGALEKLRAWSRSIEDLQHPSALPAPFASSLARSARQTALRYVPAVPAAAGDAVLPCTAAAPFSRLRWPRRCRLLRVVPSTIQLWCVPCQRAVHRAVLPVVYVVPLCPVP